jgi:hypothetical protein
MTNPTWWRPLRGSSAVAVVASPPKRSPRRTVKTISRPVQRQLETCRKCKGVARPPWLHDLSS